MSCPRSAHNFPATHVGSSLAPTMVGSHWDLSAPHLRAHGLQGQVAARALARQQFSLLTFVRHRASENYACQSLSPPDEKASHQARRYPPHAGRGQEESVDRTSVRLHISSWVTGQSSSAGYDLPWQANRRPCPSHDADAPDRQFPARRPSRLSIWMGSR